MKFIFPVLAAFAALSSVQARAASIVEFQGDILTLDACCKDVLAVEHDHLWCANLTGCGDVSMEAPAATTIENLAGFKFPDGSLVPAASPEVKGKFQTENAEILKRKALPEAGDTCMVDYAIVRHELVKRAAWAPSSGIWRTIGGGLVGGIGGAVPTALPLIPTIEGIFSDPSTAEAALATLKAALPALAGGAITGAAIGGGVLLAAYITEQTILITEIVRLDHVLAILHEARLGQGKHLHQLSKKLRHDRLQLLQRLFHHGKRKVLPDELLVDQPLLLLDQDDASHPYSPMASLGGRELNAKGEPVDGLVRLTLPCAESDPLAKGCAAGDDAVLARAIEKLDRSHRLCDGELSRAGKKPAKKLRKNVVLNEHGLAKALRRYLRTDVKLEAPLAGARGYTDNGLTRIMKGAKIPGVEAVSRDAANMTVSATGNILDLR